MSTQWYLRKADSIYGPVDTARLRALLQAGQISGDQEVAKSVDGPFRPVRSVELTDPSLTSLVPKYSPAPSGSAAAPAPAAFTYTTAARDKVINELASRHRGWVMLAGFIAGALLRKAMFGDSDSAWTLLPPLAGVAIAFSVWTSVRTQSLGRNDDQVLQLLYEEHCRRQMTRRIVGAVATLILVGFFGLAFLGKLQEPGGKTRLLSDARPQLVAHKVDDDVVFSAGDGPDLAYTVRTTFKNNGKRGEIYFKVTLTTSEGQYERERTEFMEAGETQHYATTFAEPTTKAGDVRYRVQYLPVEQ